jgi:hypothetical protein
MARKKKDQFDLATALAGEITLSSGGISSAGNDDGLTKNAISALAYYFGEAPAPVGTFNSGVISTDIADMIDANLASLLPAFETENVVYFEPQDESDIEQAQIESDAVNHFIRNENQGYVLFQTAFKDALLLRNSIIKTYVDEKINVEKISFVGLTELELMAVITPSNDPNVMLELVSMEYNENEPDLYDVTIKQTITEKKLKLKVVDPLNFVYDLNYDKTCLEDISFCGERCFYTRSQLMDMGFDASVVNELPKSDPVTSDIAAVRMKNAGVGEVSAQPSQDIITVYECIYYYDSDGDGINERHEILYVPQHTILSDEIVPFNPFASGTAFIQPHRFAGMSIFDKLRQVQDTKTFVLRQYLDSFITCNNPRLAVLEGMVNLSDAADTVPGGLIRVKALDAIRPIPGMDIGASAIQLLDYQDRMTTQRAGAGLELQSGSAQVAMSQSATATALTYSVKEQMSALMCRTIAETLIADVYKNVHRALRHYMSGSISFQNAGVFKKTDASQWKERNKVTIKSGLSMTERTRKVQTLQQILMLQTQMMQMGMGVMVDLNKMYHANIDLLRASGIDTPERYFIDPKSQESQQAQQAQSQQAQQTQQKQDMILGAQLNIEQEKNDIAKAKVTQETIFNYWNAHLDAEIESLKLIGDSVSQQQIEKLRAISGFINAKANAVAAVSDLKEANNEESEADD